MTKVAVLFAVFAAIFAGISSAMILTFSHWSRTSTPLATVATAVDNFTEVGELKTSKFSFTSPSGTDDSTDSEDADSTDSVLQAALSSDDDNDDPDQDDHGSKRGSHEDDSTDSDDDAFSVVSSPLSSGSKASPVSMNAAFRVGSVLNAISTIEATYVNWVGSALDTSIASACYREAHIAKTCPLGFDSKLGMCWAQCPYSYPVECGLECIRQNDDCALEIATKVGTVVQITLSFATMGVFGNFYKLAKGMQRAVKCFKSMLGLTKSLVKYTRYIKVSNPETSQDEILAILHQTDNVVIDIPMSSSPTEFLPLPSCFWGNH